MANKIKLEVTEAQLEAIIELTNEASAMLGTGDDAIKSVSKWIRQVDRMLKKHGYKRQYN